MSAAQATTTSPPRKRRWFQYSLRTLLVLVMLASVGMSWLAVRLQKARRQERALARLKQAGVEALFNYQVEKNPRPSDAIDWRYSYKATPLAPQQVRTAVGEDYFRAVVAIRLPETATDESLEQLADIPDLIDLYAPSSRITDAGLSHLESVPKLKVLIVRNTAISDTGATHLQRLTRMKLLDISGTRITDRGVAFLKDMKGLDGLCLERIGLSDTGLAHLADLTQLRTVNLSNTKVTSAGLKYIKKWNLLETLFLDNTQVDDKGVELLASLDLDRLKTISLAACQVSDDGLQHLASIKSLREVRVAYTRVTARGTDRLRQSLAGVQVDRVRATSGPKDEANTNRGEMPATTSR